MTDILRATWSLGSVMVGGGVDLAPALTSGLVTVDDGSGGMTGIVIDGPDAIAVAIAVTALPDLCAAAKHGLRQCELLINELYSEQDSSSYRGLLASLEPIRAALAKAGAPS